MWLPGYKTGYNDVLPIIKLNPNFLKIILQENTPKVYPSIHTHNVSVVRSLTDTDHIEVNRL